MRISYKYAKSKIREISKLDKKNTKCFFTDSKNVTEHHPLSVWRVTQYWVTHPYVPLVKIKEAMPKSMLIIRGIHDVIHFFQGEREIKRNPTEIEKIEMFIYKEQLRNQSREANYILDNEAAQDFKQIYKEQIENVERNLDKYGFEFSPDIIQDYFNEVKSNEETTIQAS
jgi:hypothetical protein